MLPRRFLPSLASLLALEAVDRLGSASAAAEELALTQGAVSRQLKALEEQMGVSLIRRDAMRLQLTPSAREYVSEVRELLQRLAQSSLKLKANPTGGGLTLSMQPAFGMHWLTPRLKSFVGRNPGVSLNLQTHTNPFDFDSSGVTAAIHFGSRHWSPRDWGTREKAELDVLPLMAKQVIPVCAPSLLKQPVSDPLELTRQPLLHLDTHPESWEQWFELQGCPATDLKGMLFDQSSTMTQAAIHGLGVALIASFLAKEEIEQGRLMQACEARTVSLGQYYLVWPKRHGENAGLVRFRSWLQDEIRDGNS
ncbi:LysR substrate-binding domain-containing protein [Kiloniella sp. b19]|uniref:LysR substrate-binding domain-containing protein n=1 Tax=Kiloniella sp. GXU_MW_B19 TaxID=3141326 RepID=UPI0031E266F5